MNGNNYDDEISFPVVTNWNNLSNCPLASKRWVNRENVEQAKSYEKGDFLRVYCEHDMHWCDAENGYEYCQICTDHLDELNS